MPLEEVRAAAQRAKDAGATRFCMGASYRGPKDSQLEPILEMVKEVKALGLETCATLGLLRAGPGRAARRRRPRLLQPQLGLVGRVLREDHQHAHLCRSARDARARARGRRQGLLRRHRRHGRDARRPRRLAAHARDAGAAARKRADQRARADPGHAARVRRAARSVRVRALHRRRADPDAALARAAVRGPQRLQRRAAGAVLLRRRELDLLRREAADDGQSRHGGRSAPVRAPRLGARRAAAAANCQRAAAHRPCH